MGFLLLLLLELEEFGPSLTEGGCGALFWGTCSDVVLKLVGLFVFMLLDEFVDEFR